MITLEDFQKYETLERSLKAFLIEKCHEYDEAKYDNEGNDHTNTTEVYEEDYDCWEIHGLKIIVWFNGRHREDGQYTYELPLDCLFSHDFKTLLKKRFEEEREKQRLDLIEKRMKQSEEYKRLEEKKTAEEITKLKELMEKYPEVSKELK